MTGAGAQKIASKIAQTGRIYLLLYPNGQRIKTIIINNRLFARELQREQMREREKSQVKIVGAIEALQPAMTGVDINRIADGQNAQHCYQECR